MVVEHGHEGHHEPNSGQPNPSPQTDHNLLVHDGPLTHVLFFRPGEIMLDLEPPPGFREAADDADEEPISKDAQEAFRIAYDSVRRTESGLRQLPDNLVGDRSQIVLPHGKARRSVLQTINLGSRKRLANLKANGHSEDEVSPARLDAINEVPDAVEALNLAIDKDEIGDLAGYRLKGVSPVYFLFAQGWGCGCPGGRPKPVPEGRHFSADVVNAKVQELLGSTPRKLRGQGVRVAVFDTSPWGVAPDKELGKIRAAARKYKANASLATWDALTPPVAANRFRNYVSRSPDVAASHLGCDGKFEPPYVMESHGFFVMNILRDIAPQAHISVYRVLDNYGCGDLDAVARAIRHAVKAARNANQKLILNFSFGFSPTVAMFDHEFKHAHHAYEHPDDFAQMCRTEHNKPKNKQAEEAALRHTALRAVATLFDIADEPDILGIASAGNDSCRNQGAPGAQGASPRLPAILPGVVGVSAFTDKNNTWKEAEFSNEDNFLEPPIDAVGALGEGVVGLCTHEPPDMPAGTVHNGWVQWDGTSFATPIISGLAACIWSEKIAAGDDSMPTLRRALLGTDANPRSSINMVQDEVMV